MYKSNRSSTQHYLKLSDSTGSSQHWLFERHCVHGNVWSTGWMVHRLCRILFWVMPQYLKIFKPPFKSLFSYFTWQKKPTTTQVLKHRCAEANQQTVPSFLLPYHLLPHGFNLCYKLLWEQACLFLTHLYNTKHDQSMSKLWKDIFFNLPSIIMDMLSFYGWRTKT